MRPLTKGPWGVGMPYGLGTMDLGSQLGGYFTRPKGVFIGHGGETCKTKGIEPLPHIPTRAAADSQRFDPVTPDGFTGYVGYVPKLNASLAVFANAEDAIATTAAAAGALSLMGV